MKHIIINHPDGDISLDEVQKDLNFVQPILDNEIFDSKIVQALINKIVEQDAIIQGYENLELIEEVLFDKPINTSKGQYVVALENTYAPFISDIKLSKDRTYECLEDSVIKDNFNIPHYFNDSFAKRNFRQATEEEIKAYKESH